MRRVLLKLSGEALAGDKKTGFDEATVTAVAKQVKKIVDEGIQTAIRRQLIRLIAYSSTIRLWEAI